MERNKLIRKVNGYAYDPLYAMSHPFGIMPINYHARGGSHRQQLRIVGWDMRTVELIRLKDFINIKAL